MFDKNHSKGELFLQAQYRSRGNQAITTVTPNTLQYGSKLIGKISLLLKQRITHTH